MSPVAAPDLEDVCPMGYLSENWLGANEDTPALIVNPDASPADLLAWACGELRSLEATGHALMDMASPGATFEARHFEAMFVHRIGPVERVVDLALARLLARQKASAVSGGTL